MAELSPMMKQYFDIKNNYKDAILFFRLGDFYEMFYEDAITASRELELTLTGKDCGQEERAPMCGIPYHAYESYVAKLIKKGYKVAICEQMEDPALAKGIVKRDIIRVITPGTVVESAMLEESSNNYICSLYVKDGRFSICFCDVTTGELKCTYETCKTELESRIIEEISRYKPSEILYNSDLNRLSNVMIFISERMECHKEEMNDDLYEINSLTDTVCSHFKKNSVKQLNITCDETTYCIGILISYLYNTQKNGVSRISEISFYQYGSYMKLDLSARRNLELTESIRGRDRKGTLLWVMDKTSTSMGRRLLKSFMDRPLLDPVKIDNRLSAVEFFYNDPMLSEDLASELSGVYDLERMVTRMMFGNASPREYRTLSNSISKLPKIKGLLSSSTTFLVKDIYSRIDLLTDIKELIDVSINEDPPVTLKDGNVIKPGYSAELDELRELVFNIKEKITSIETSEKNKTGIPKLKIGYNHVFGYYIEVSNSYKDKVPETYIRKQTLANGERYITEELKDLESKVLGAHDRILSLESQLFEDVRNRVSSQVSRIQQTADAIALLDVMNCFAQVASKNNYTRPTIDLGDIIEITEGRHPVVEQVLHGAPFVPNDVLLDNRENQIAVITGPNMAGKSTYMRQVALITIMAQMGSFVPAKSAHIGIVDGVYTRVGASDDLSAGQSTFMVEMSEVAEILNNASQKSLLIFDEIGRGTSTYDGMSIAHAVLEHIADKKKLGAKTLFATHYHELTDLENVYPNIRNYNVAVKKHGEDITFLRRIISGGADDSYGIEVAKLAGIPNSVVVRAREILASLEEGKEIERASRKKEDDGVLGQTCLFSSYQSDAERIIRQTDVDTLSPLEALNLLYELKSIVKK